MLYGCMYMTQWFSTAQILPATHMYIYYNDYEYSYIVLSRLTLSKQIRIFIKAVGFSGWFSAYKWATFWVVKLHLLKFYKWGDCCAFVIFFSPSSTFARGLLYKNRGRFARRPLVFWRLLQGLMDQNYWVQALSLKKTTIFFFFYGICIFMFYDYGNNVDE